MGPSLRILPWQLVRLGKRKEAQASHFSGVVLHCQPYGISVTRKMTLFVFVFVIKIRWQICPVGLSYYC